MPERPYLQHGDRHRPLGTDPIPGLGTAAEWCFVKRETNFSVPTITSSRIPWTHFSTSNASIFTETTVDNTNDTIAVAGEGIYLVSAQMNWTSPQIYPRWCQITTDLFGVSGGAASPLSDSTVDTTASTQTMTIHDTMTIVTQSVPGNIYLLGHNADVSSHNVTSSYMMIVYLANSTLVT